MEKLAKLAINKSLLKEYSNSSNDRIVYMKDNTEFQIQLFNPYSYVIGAKFKFNNKEIKNTLVLRPGERIWLDRYLDDKSKLLFSTYEVGNSTEVKKAIENNGNVVIEFYNEREFYRWDSEDYGTISISSGITTTQEPISIWTSNKLVDVSPLDSLDSGIRYSNTCAYTNANYSCSSSPVLTASSSSASSTNIKVGTNSCVNKNIETGRIEKGSYSNQKFKNVDMEFSYFPFKTELIKILPESMKQINSNDLQKRYCHNCGRRLKDKFKFCPFCGTKQ